MDEDELDEILSNGRFGGFIKREYAKYLIANEEYHKAAWNVKRGSGDVFERVEKGDKLPDEAHLRAAWRDYQLMGRQGIIQRAERRGDFEEAQRQRRAARMTPSQFDALAFLVTKEARSVPIDDRRYYEPVGLTKSRQRHVQATTASAARKANRVYRLVLDGRPRAKYSQGPPRFKILEYTKGPNRGRKAKVYFDPHTGERLHRFWLR